MKANQTNLSSDQTNWLFFGDGKLPIYRFSGLFHKWQIGWLGCGPLPGCWLVINEGLAWNPRSPKHVSCHPWWSLTSGATPERIWSNYSDLTRVPHPKWWFSDLGREFPGYFREIHVGEIWKFDQKGWPPQKKNKQPLGSIIPRKLQHTQSAIPLANY